MRIALAQVASPDDESPPARRARVRELLDDLPPDVDLVVLPELWAVGFQHFDDYRAEAERLDGETVRVCAEIARKAAAWVLAGSIVQRTADDPQRTGDDPQRTGDDPQRTGDDPQRTGDAPQRTGDAPQRTAHAPQRTGDDPQRTADGVLRNTTVLLDPSGEVAATTSKIHVFGYASREVELLSPGDSVCTVRTPFGTVASTTCYDLRFPGLWNVLVDAGAELVLVPAAWPAARLAHWRLLTAARAVDTQTFVIACNSAGTQDGVTLGGHSRVVDPWGEVVAEAGPDEQVLVVDIDPTLVHRTRAEFPVLADRLDDYRALRASEVTA
jgi:predicted amidohydrolase